MFAVTLISTAFTGAVTFIGRSVAWEAGDTILRLGSWSVTDAFLADSFTFAGGLIFFLTVHEFGHYVLARIHGVRTSLPYFIPAPLIGIGTLGAVINIREPIPTGRKLFDVGAAGPLAGFVIAILLLLWALATLPSPEFMYGVGGHEPLLQYINVTGQFPETPLGTQGDNLTVGSTLLYWGLTQFFADVPPMYEMYHYPLLFAAWLGLFFTAFNLMPVGQLDGGHITCALFGLKWHRRIARTFVFILLTSMAVGGVRTLPSIVGGFVGQPFLVVTLTWFVIGALLALCTRRVWRRSWLPVMVSILVIASVSQAFPALLHEFGYFGWLPWCLVLIFLIKVDHPPVADLSPLSRTRRVLGVLSMLIFVLCFSLRPLYFS
ncbi:MAG: site-2 protease family protein [Bacteroidota bacterium]|nr:site-2 protease family protein [Bacteroidota bacterium]